MKFNPKIIQYALLAASVVALVFLVLWVVRIFNPPDGTAKEVKAELSEIKAGLTKVGGETKAILKSAEIIQLENLRIKKLLQQDSSEAERQRQAYESDTRKLRQKIDALRAGFETDRAAREEIMNTANKYPPLIAK